MTLWSQDTSRYLWWPALVVNGSYPTTANLGKLIKLTARFPFLNHFIRPAAHCGTTGYNKTLISFPYDFSYIFPCTRSKLFYISITLLARLYPPLNQPNKPAVNWPSSPVDPPPKDPVLRFFKHPRNFCLC